MKSKRKQMARRRGVKLVPFQKDSSTRNITGNTLTLSHYMQFKPASANLKFVIRG